MNTKSKINFLGALLFWALFLMGGNVLAQEEDVFIDPRKGKVAEAVVVATVNIDSAKIVSQEKDALKISFNLSNRVGAQDNVRYAVELRDPENEMLADQKIFDEAVFLGENQSVSREVVYGIPAYLQGGFRVFVSSQNEKGLSFGSVLAGEIELEGAAETIRVDSKGCYLDVTGNPTKYNPYQGVDVAPDEELVLHCATANSFKNDISAVAGLRTTFRSAFGRTVSEQTGETVSFRAGEKRGISLVIPKAEAPQAYDVELFFRDDSGRVVSNPVFIHYVLQGASATINNITLDKDSYSKGEMAHISFYWAGRADYFPGSRSGQKDPGKTFVQIDTLKENGKKCAAPFRQELEVAKNGFLGKAQIEMTADCANGRMVVALTDEKGRVLDEKTFEFRKIVESGISQYLAVSLYLGAGIIFLIGVGMIWIKRRRSHIQTGMTTFLIFFGILMAGEEARADTFYLNHLVSPEVVDQGFGGQGAVYWTATYTVNMSGTRSNGLYQYCKNELVAVTMTGSWNGCNNAADHIGSTVIINGVRSHPFMKESGSGRGTKRFYVENFPGGDFTAETYGTIWIQDEFEADPNNYESAQLNQYYSIADCVSSSPPPVEPTPPAPDDPPSAPNPLPYGWYYGTDNADCSVSGWARDDSDRSQTLGIRIFANGKAPFDGGSGIRVGTGFANLPSGTNFHAFKISLRGTAVDDGLPHITYAYADDYPNSNLHKGLQPSAGAVRTIQCFSPPVSAISATKNSQPVVVVAPNSPFNINWSSSSSPAGLATNCWGSARYGDATAVPSFPDQVIGAVGSAAVSIDRNATFSVNCWDAYSQVPTPDPKSVSVNVCPPPKCIVGNVCVDPGAKTYNACNYVTPSCNGQTDIPPIVGSTSCTSTDACGTYVETDKSLCGCGADPITTCPTLNRNWIETGS